MSVIALTPEDTTLHRHFRLITVNIVTALADAEVGDFAIAFEIDQNVVCLQVSMQDTLAVKVRKTRQDLDSEILYDLFLELAMFSDTATDTATWHLYRLD